MSKIPELRYERQCLVDREDAYLREKGWTYTCRTPGSFWVWTREVEGRVMFVDRGLALSMQEHLDIMSDDEQLIMEGEQE